MDTFIDILIVFIALTSIGGILFSVHLIKKKSLFNNARQAINKYYYNQDTFTFENKSFMYSPDTGTNNAKEKAVSKTSKIILTHEFQEYEMCI